MTYSVIRSHEICAGHRVVGHESKCRHLHGHNYVFHFKVQPKQETRDVWLGETSTKRGVTQAILQEMPVFPSAEKEAATARLLAIAGVPEDKIKKITEDNRGRFTSKLDNLGRVIDFSVVKSTLCQWLEDNWDHKFLHWENDPLIAGLAKLAKGAPKGWGDVSYDNYFDSLVPLPFNPTAENLAAHMVNVVGPMLLAEHGVELVSCTIEETSKCHVEYTK